mgnify:CR=1 FL=1
MASRRAIDYKGFGDKAPNPDDLEAGHRGIAGSRMLESNPGYVKADNEKVIQGLNGEYIVLGRDRPASRLSGYGSEHQAARIDIVVGRVSAQRDIMDASAASGGTPVNDLRVDPSMEYDAARVYISQKADIDEYFALRPGTVGMSEAKSAIGIKADAVRIVGREGIKLVTRTDALNSQGGTMERVRGIDLIAGNDDNDLQPLIKGNNLVGAIDALARWVSKLNGLVDGILLDQIQMNTALTIHTHQGTLLAPVPVPVQTLPSLDLAPIAAKVGANLLIKTVSLKSHRMNLESIKMNYLKPWGRDYICSRYNNVN